MIQALLPFLPKIFSKGSAIIITLVAISGYAWYNSYKADEYKAKAEALSSHLSDASALIAEKSNQLDYVQRKVTESVASTKALQRKYLESREYSARLEDKLEKHDLGLLAKNKPGLVRGVINSGVQRLFDSFEATTREFYSGGIEAPVAAKTEPVDSP